MFSRKFNSLCWSALSSQLKVENLIKLIWKIYKSRLVKEKDQSFKRTLEAMFVDLVGMCQLVVGWTWHFIHAQAFEILQWRIRHEFLCTINYF